MSAINALGPAQGVGVLDSGTAKFGDNKFLNLLIAQLQNQTPLEPVDNASFMQQMASYSSMTEQKELNSNMLSLLDYQGVLARLQSLSEGSTMLGKEVTYITKNGDKTGKVESIFVTDKGEVRMRIGKEEISMSQITGIAQGKAAITPEVKPPVTPSTKKPDPTQTKTPPVSTK